MNASRRTDPDRNSGTLLALVGLIAVGLGLLFLTALVMPTILGLVIVVVGFVFYCVFHYLVWGWWMSSLRDRDDDVAANADQEDDSWSQEE